MRNFKVLIILAIITVGFVAAALLTSKQRGAGDSTGQTRLLPGLIDQINDIGRIVIERANGSVTLHYQDGQWRLLEKEDYPASRAQVRQLALGLAELVKIEPKTANPELYEKLGVTDKPDKDPAAARVRVSDQNQNVIAEVILGKRRPSRAGANDSEVYARLAGEPQSWLVEGRLPEAWEELEWLDKDLLKLDRKRIRSVHLAHDGQDPYTVERQDPDGTDFQLTDLKADETLSSNYVANAIPGTFGNLSLIDVRRAEGVELPKQPAHVLGLETYDGLSVVAKIYPVEKHFYLQLQARKAPQEKTSGDPKDEADTTAKLAEEIKSLNARWQGWLYRVAPYQLANLRKPRQELLKKPDDPAADSADKDTKDKDKKK